MSLIGKRVLVTGAGGFVGSHLVEGLIEASAKVTALVHYNARGRTGWLRRDLGAEIVFGDICDEYYMGELANSDFDIVFHLAALISVPHSQNSPNAYIHANIIGTHNILTQFRMMDVGRIVTASSSEIYGSPDVIPLRENSMRHPQSIYAATKIAADALAHASHTMHGVDVVIIRPFNIYGPRQSLRAVIPRILTQLIDGSKVVEIGNAHTARDFTYVTDVVNAYMQAGIVPDISGQDFNIGSGEMISIRDLVSLCAKILGVKDVEIKVNADRVRPHSWEVDRLLACSSKAEMTLGWKPLVNLSSGISTTSDWIEKNRGEYQEANYA